MNVLVVVAHADDETLGAGGIIQRLAKREDSVSVVICSDGLIRTRGREQNDRPAAFVPAEKLGIATPIFLDYPDQKFDAIPMADFSSNLAQRNRRPDLIITHFEGDLNKDQRLTAETAKLLGRPREKPVAILACEIPNAAFWNGASFPANFYVDISNDINTKIDAFAQHTNECQEFPHPWSRKGLRLLAQYHGMQSGSICRGFSRDSSG